MPNKISQTYIAIILFTLLSGAVACSLLPQNEKVRIGFSQCTMDDVWRVQMLQELKREAAFINDIDFLIILKDAGNDSEKQKNDIRQLIKAGIDILIVSPNQREPLKSIIDSVVQLDIPVILIDRDIRTELPTYFIGASNFNIGEMAGQKAISLLPNGGSILVFAGLEGSAPAIQRQNGFRNALTNYNNYQIKPIRCDWTEETAYKLMLNFKDSLNFDLVFAHNDFMARGIIRALKESNRELPPIIGIDGLNAPGCGIDMVLDSTLTATLTYPTGGDVAIQTVYKILNKQEVKRNNWLSSILITTENVKSIKLQRDEIEKQYSKIDRQNETLLNKEQEIAEQRKRLRDVAIIFTLCFSLLILLFYLRRKKQLIIVEEENEDEIQQFAIPYASKAKSDEKEFIKRIENLIKANLSNKELSVQFIGEQIGMSHSTVYRKIKKITGLTGVELIKIIRLNQAAYLLKSSNLGVEEIAFQTGFNTASYFSTSFVKQFGISPAKFRTAE